jgi:hypothetical protein
LKTKRDILAAANCIVDCGLIERFNPPAPDILSLRLQRETVSRKGAGKEKPKAQRVELFRLSISNQKGG